MFVAGGNLAFTGIFTMLPGTDALRGLGLPLEPIPAYTWLPQKVDGILHSR